ncbi:beta-galactosidase trimerization domain-containing protein [Streptomyces sp. NPDC057376]|uniref:beta-galactosidase trimerization domain-containing protein n=1 Tax=Streptomyces sp. NPDC057376 TaxID=3346110 RepID=UPI00093E1C4E|nr:beta-galactosidase trimerization domain-containing protein [Streptomyces sp. CB02414]
MALRLSDDDADNLTQYVQQGGHLTVGCFSGLVDDSDRVRPGAHPGALRDVLGLVVDEFLPLRTGERARLADGTDVEQWTERVESRGCTTVSRYADSAEGGPARGGPAVTRHAFGDGTAWYGAGRLPVPALRALLRAVCEQARITPVVEGPDGLEAVRRTGRGAFLPVPDQPHREDCHRARRRRGPRRAEATGGRAVVPPGGVVVVREDHLPASA